MQFIGFNFEKIQGERKKPIKGKLQISSNINMLSIKQENLDILKDQQPLKYDFEFSVEYKPDFASILLKGFVIAVFEKGKANDILKKWKSKKISDDVRIPLFNFIMTKCNLKALQLEEEFSLPSHIPLPKIRAQQENNANYTG